MRLYCMGRRVNNCNTIVTHGHIASQSRKIFCLDLGIIPPLGWADMANLNEIFHRIALPVMQLFIYISTWHVLFFGGGGGSKMPDLLPKVYCLHNT